MGDMTELLDECQAVVEGVKAEDMQLSEDIKEEMEIEGSAEQNAELSSIIMDITDQDEPVPSLCRLCAIQANDMIYMFGPTEMHKNIIEKIHYCLPISVKITDTLPQDACQLCLAKLELCYQFYKTVVDAEKQLLVFDQQRANKRRRNLMEAYTQTAAPCNGQHATSKHQKRQRKFSNSDMPILSPELSIPSTNVEEGNTPSTSDNMRSEPSGDPYERTNSPINALNLDRTSPPQTEEGTSSSTLNSQTRPVNSEKELRHAKKIFVPQPYTPPITRSGNKLSKKPRKKLNEQRRKSSCNISAEQLRNRMKPNTHNAKPDCTYACNWCKKNFSSRDKLKTHNQTCRKPTKTERKFACHLCVKSYTAKVNLIYHIRTHTGERPWSCDYCPKKFIRKSDKYNHHKTHTGGRARRSSSDEYQKTDSSSNHALKSGKKIPLKIERGTLSTAANSRICADKVSRKNKETPDSKSFSPVITRGRIGSKRILRKRAIVKNEEPSPNTSTKQLRNKKTMNSAKRKRVVLKKAKNIRRKRVPTNTVWTCDYCKKSYRQKGTLVHHIRSHTGERPFGCDLCPRKFVRSSYRNTHYLTHTGERPFSCKYCDKGFVLKGTRNLHERIHTGERTHGCFLCEKKFLRIDGLKAHIHTHRADKKPFNCDLCTKRFRLESFLARHKEKRHKRKSKINV